MFQSSHEADYQFLECLDDTWTFNSSISFTIAGTDPISHAGCHGDRALRTYIRIIGGRTDINITFTNIDFKQVSIEVSDASVILENCIFRDSTLEVNALGSIPVAPQMSNTHWLGLADCSDDYKCTPTGNVAFNGLLSTILIEDSIFLHTKLAIALSSDCVADIRQNVFSDRSGERAVQAGVFISMGITGQNSTINVYHNRFENQYHWNPVDSVSNIFMSALLIRFLPPTGYTLTFPNDAHVRIHNNTFDNNERAVTFQGFLENILITDSTFTNNVAMHAGAAILFIVFGSNPVQITNCTFQNNAAGFYRTMDVRAPGDYFR